MFTDVYPIQEISNDQLYTLNQICSSTLISSTWLEFVLTFHSNASVESYALVVDFRRLASSYFQLLAAICSLVQNIFDDALDTLQENQYINQYLPSESQFLEHIRLLNESFAASVQQEFFNLQSWLHLMTTESQLFVGLSLHGYLKANDDSDVVEIMTINAVSSAQVTETEITMSSVCSCRQRPTDCLIVTNLVEVEGSRPYPSRYFVGMNVGCIPWLGLLLTDTTWWHRTDIIEQIRLLFGDHLRNRSTSIITPLSNQTQTRFRFTNGSQPLFEHLLKAALLERWTGNLTRFGLFYQECALRKCIYLIQSRRSLHDESIAPSK